MSAAAAQEAEWYIPDPAVAVRQGDILISRDPKSGRVEEICIVITADCDISKGKFGRQLACLRIVWLDDYIKFAWASRKLDKTLKDETDKIRGQVAKWHTKLLGVESTLTSNAVSAWIQRESPDSLCSTLQIPETDRKKFIAAVSSYHSAITAIEKTTNGNLAKLVAFRSAIRGLELQVCHQEALQQAQREALPEDVFLLPNLPQLGNSAAVVLLREIVGIAGDSVSLRAADAQSNDVFLRVGRLLPTFKYAVSQAFGSLYSRIGLPEDYESRCKGAIENISNLALE
jgi:hypothetical protein